MKYEITHTPSYALGVISLSGGESIQAESGAMVSMSESVSMKTEVRGGIMSGLKRKALGGESFFINEFKAEEMSGEVTVAPSLPGDIIALEVGEQPLLIQTKGATSGSFLAASPEVVIDTKFGGGRRRSSRGRGCSC